MNVDFLNRFVGITFKYYALPVTSSNSWLVDYYKALPSGSPKAWKASLNSSNTMLSYTNSLFTWSDLPLPINNI